MTNARMRSRASGHCSARFARHMARLCAYHVGREKGERGTLPSLDPRAAVAVPSYRDKDTQLIPKYACLHAGCTPSTRRRRRSSSSCWSWLVLTMLFRCLRIMLRQVGNTCNEVRENPQGLLTVCLFCSHIRQHREPRLGSLLPGSYLPTICSGVHLTHNLPPHRPRNDSLQVHPAYQNDQRGRHQVYHAYSAERSDTLRTGDLSHQFRKFGSGASALILALQTREP